MYKLLFPVLTLFFVTACQAQEAGSKNVTVEQAKEMIAGDEVVIIDVRTPDEYNGGHIEGARQIDFYSDDFEAQLAELPKDKSYLVYCHSGNRSGKTMAKMKEMGFPVIYNLQGGISSWKAGGNKTVK